MLKAETRNPEVLQEGCRSFIKVGSVVKWDSFLFDAIIICIFNSMYVEVGNR